MPRSIRPCPAVVFVTGAWNASQVGLGEDEELRALADYLGEHGIAVLQIQTPLGGRSISNLDSAGSATFEPDLMAGLNFLKQQPGVDPKQVGLFGENENGAIATVMATLNKDVAFLILGGTPIVARESSTRPSGLVQTYDLRPILEKVTCPVLVVQGDQETSVPVRANLAAYRTALTAAKNHDTAFIALPGLNRALETTLGDGHSEADMAPLAMRTVARWISRDPSVPGATFTLDTHGDEDEKLPHRKVPNRYGDVPVFGQYQFRPEMVWLPTIGGQDRYFGYWYW